MIKEKQYYIDIYNQMTEKEDFNTGSLVGYYLYWHGELALESWLENYSKESSDTESFKKEEVTNILTELLTHHKEEVNIETEFKEEKKMPRKSWDAYFLEIAEVVATRATCERLQVGCVLVKNKNIISTGYNGSIHGHPHCIDEGVGCLLNDEGRCIRTIHAEENAVLHANREELQGATAYVSHMPCEKCSKTLAQAGIKRIVYRNHYDNKYNQYFLTGIELVHLENQN